MLQEIFAWLMLFAKWEVSVYSWKAAGRPYWFSILACITHAFVYFGAIWGLFSGIIGLARLIIRKVRIFLWRRGFWPRWLSRDNWNGNSKPRQLTGLRARAHKFAVWLAKNKFWIITRYTLLYLIAATPVLPLTIYVAIVFAKITKTKAGFWVIMAGIVTKVIITVKFIYKI